MKFRFFEPGVLLWIPILWMGILLLWWWQARQFQNFQKLLGEKTWTLFIPEFSTSRRRFKWFLRSCGLSLVLVAWARPQGGEGVQNVKSQGIEMVALVDVSESMMAEDLKPNRLAQARVDLTRLVELQRGSMVGLVAFAGSATLMSPLTSDPGALRMYTDSLSPLSVSTQGTQFAAALSEAEEAFARGGVSEDEQTRVAKVILIFSDGEDHEPGALEAAKKLRDKGYRIFTVAYGTEQGAPIPERDQMGYLRGNKKDDSGNPVWTRVNGKALEALAQAGAGEFYFATSGGDHIERLNQNLDNLEKADFDSQLTTNYREWFQVPLTLAVLLLILELLISERRKLSARWAGRFEVRV